MVPDLAPFLTTLVRVSIRRSTSLWPQEGVQPFGIMGDQICIDRALVELPMRLRKIAAMGMETNQLGAAVAATHELAAFLGIPLHNH